MSLPSTAAVRLLTGEREPVRLATTANIDVDTGGLLVIDGVQTEVGDRILVKDQTDGSENGIRTASTGQWYRAADARTARTMQKGTTVTVQEGTVNAGLQFMFNTLNPVIGDDSLIIVEYVPSAVSDWAGINAPATPLAVGDMIYASGVATLSRLAKGRALQGMRQNAGATAPEWADFQPGYDVTGFAGGSESARLLALFAAAPTQPYTYRSDSHIGIIRDTAPLNYQGTRASLVLQHRDVASGGASDIIPGAIFQFTSTGDGVVNAGSDTSQTVWMGLLSTMTKTGDGSGHAYTAIVQVGAYGAGLYNEGGIYQGTATNIGSLHASMSGVEVLLQDSPDAGVTDYDTTMNAVIGRVARWNGGTRKSRNFFASSEGDKALDAILGVNTAGYPHWSYGIDLIGAIFDTGQAIVLPNNNSIAAMNAAGNSRKPLLLLNSTDDTWLLGATTTATINLGNSAFAKSLAVVGVATAVNYFEMSGALSGQAPLLSAKGSDTNVGISVGTKGTGVYSFYTNGASFAKQFEIGHVASSVNYVQLNGAATTAAPLQTVQGSDTNIGAGYGTKGTGVHSFYTNGSSLAKQVEIGHIASSVNYLSFVGAVTTGAPLVSVLGSDANIGLGHATKGTGVHSFFSNGTVKQFEIGHVASAVNYVQAVGAVTTAAPLLSALGTDTNIGFGIATKGTGVISLFTATSAKQVEISHLASAANWVTLAGGIAGAPAFVAIGAAGASTDVDLFLSGKGAGLVTLPVGQITASATAGANGAPPAQVSGYMKMKLSGNVAIRVPYYNA